MAYDNWDGLSYNQLVDEHRAYLTIELNLAAPIELSDFVGLFGAISAQYDRYMRDKFPGDAPRARIFVKEFRQGSIIADLFPGAVGELIDLMDDVLIVTGFSALIAGIIKTYVSGGRNPNAKKQDLGDYLKSVVAIAKDPNGRGVISRTTYEQGVARKVVVFEFDTEAARSAAENIEKHKSELDEIERADRERVLMTFKRSDIGNVDLGKRSGERVVIEDISDKDLPLIYASRLAEDEIKDLLRHSEENIYKKGLVVDVNVQTKSDRPIAYAVTRLHQTIDLPDD